MRKTFIFFGILALLASIFSVAPQAKAMTVAEIQALIQQLQQQIAELKQQLIAVQGTTPAWCYTFNNNLGFINTGSDEVFQLHTALQKENISYSSDDSSTYAEDTSAAVVQFQARYGIRQTGYVGPLTRAKLNKLYGCGATVSPVPSIPPISAPATTTPVAPPSTTVPSITVISPNGGEQLQVGNTYRIKWNSANIYNVKINIVDDTNPGSGSTNYITPFGNAISASAGYYDWTITSQQLPIGTSNNRYKIYIYNNENSSIYDSSDNYFTIVGAKITAPYINVTYPVAGETLQKGSITYINMKFSPSVPLGGLVVNLLKSDTYEAVAHLKYCGLDNVTYDAVKPPNVSWQWKVGYDADGKEIPAGSYRIFVYDCGSKIDTVWTGGAASAKSGVFSIVASTIATPSITVISPNGGEVFQQGKNNTISWKGGKNKVQIGIVKSNFDPARDGVLGWIFTSASPNQSGTWDANSVSGLSLEQIGNILSLSPGPFKIIAVSESAAGNYCFGAQTAPISSDCNFDYSDNYFSIVAAVTALPDFVVPTDTIIAPTFGTVDQDASIVFTIVNQGNAAGNAIYLYIDQAGGFSTIHPLNTCVNSTVLQPGASCFSAYKIRFSTPGVKTLKVKLDSSNQIQESNENNNDVSITLTINSPATPSIAVLSPSGSSLLQGQQTTITWTTQNYSGLIGLDLFQNDNFIVNIATSISNAGYYIWTVPTILSGTGFKIKAVLSDTIAGSVADFSDASLSIVAPIATPSITLFNYTETDTYGGSVKFSWSGTGADGVRFVIPCYYGLSIKYADTGLDFFCGESDRMFLINNTVYLKFTNTSALINTIATLTPVIGGTNYAAYSKSVNFSIVVVPSITVLSPNGGEMWDGNQQQKISWSSNGNIYSQADILIGGYDQAGNQIGDWKLITAGVSTAQGYYYWVPFGAPLYLPSGFLITPSQYKIKIREANDKIDAVYDVSNNYFSIVVAFGFNDIENQLASVSAAIYQLAEQVKQLLGR